MIHQKDWFMRQIEAMVAAILQFLCHTDSAAAEETTKEADLREQISEAIQNRKLCQTEDWLWDHADGADLMWLKIAVFFYSEANKLTDAELETANFSREEIQSGLLEIARRYGLEGIL